MTVEEIMIHIADDSDGDIAFAKELVTELFRDFAFHDYVGDMRMTDEMLACAKAAIQQGLADGQRG
jgi:hypothetical protein